MSGLNHGKSSGYKDINLENIKKTIELLKEIDETNMVVLIENLLEDYEKTYSKVWIFR